MGTTKWVHHSCLQRWVDEEQKGVSKMEVKCPQCGTTYAIKYPNANTFILLMDLCETVSRIGFPVLTIGLSAVCLYWCGLSFGAVTVLQVLGHERGQEMLNRTHPVILGATLPLIPTGLLVGKFFPWEELALRGIRRVLPKIPLCRYIFPIFCQQQTTCPHAATVPPSQYVISIPRTICGAMLFPTISTIFGSIFYQNVESTIHRTMLGAATYVLGKGALKIYHKQYNFVRQSQRKIMDFQIPFSASDAQ